MTTFRRFLRDEAGAVAIEYGLIAALIGAACIGVLSALGTSLSGTFGSIASSLTQAGS